MLLEFFFHFGYKLNIKISITFIEINFYRSLFFVILNKFVDFFYNFISIIYEKNELKCHYQIGSYYAINKY